MNFQMNVEQDNCPICQESLQSKQTYELPECKHIYHTECILEWFRNRPISANYDDLDTDGKCPCCGNRGINNTKRCYRNLRTTRRRWFYGYSNFFKEKLAAMKNYEKKNNGPQELTHVLNKWEKTKLSFITAQEQYTNYKKTLKSNTACKYFESKKMLTQLRQQVWHSRTSMRRHSKLITEFPFEILIIPMPPEHGIL